MQQRKKGFVVPHVYVILFALILICSLLSYVIPASQYDMTLAGGREVVDAASHHLVDPSPVTLMQLLSAVPRGMTESAQIIFFIFIVGGTFAIIQKSGAIEAGIGKICQLLGGRTLILIPVILLLFSMGGAVFGMAEETIPFIPIFVSLCIAMGYDSITGTAIVFCGSGAGFAGAFMNPFTVQVAQSIAGVPILSGIGFRLAMYFAYLILTSAFVMWYAQRVKRDPARSCMYEEDKLRNDVVDLNNLKPFGAREKLVLAVFAGSIFLLVFGVVRWGWYMDEISALFIGMAIVIAAVVRMSPNEFAVTFGNGMAEIASGALVVGFARGVLVVLTDGSILHTILHAAAVVLENLPSTLSALGMYLFQCLLNFLVPSGSGQAAVSIPIMAPLGDLVGVSRQTACIAYQLGDGISNIFTPTSGFFMAGLALARIPWSKWARWILPLIGIQYALGAVFVVIAHLIGLGPF